jgi:APA family basic amino acid/polyamine antiporter
MADKIGIPGRALANCTPRNVGEGDIPRASVLGTIATAVVHMLSLTVVFGIVPTLMAPRP